MLQARGNTGENGKECRLCNTGNKTTENLAECEEISEEMVTEMEIKADHQDTLKVIRRFNRLEEALLKQQQRQQQQQ